MEGTRRTTDSVRTPTLPSPKTDGSEPTKTLLLLHQATTMSATAIVQTQGLPAYQKTLSERSISPKR